MNQSDNSQSIKKKGVVMRIFLGFMLPPFIGALPMAILLMWVVMLDFMVGEWADGVSRLIQVFETAYVMVGLQAVIFSIIMELFVTAKKKMLLCCVIGGALGFISGVLPIVLAIIVDGSDVDILEMMAFFGILGFICGALTACILKRHYNKHNQLDRKKGA